MLALSLTLYCLSAPPRYGTDVQAVLAKAGCNQGACHGNLNGKGGFKLSLRGDDPAFDLASLTRDLGARRTDRFRPDESLLLQKATAAVPHEGGRRFGPQSPEYAILANWIAAGMPGDAVPPKVVRLDVTPAEQFAGPAVETVQLHAIATFSDGRRVDVTRLACYELSDPRVAEVTVEGTVRRHDFGETAVAVRYLGVTTTARLAFVPERPGFTWPNPPERNLIDRHVYAKLRALREVPAAPADDGTFLRRATLDATGQLPTAAEARAFLADGDPDKRAKLIDRLLAKPEFADFWAAKWADVLRSEEKALDRKGMQALHGWLRDRIAAGRPLTEFARDLLTARGSTYANPAANFYRALRDPYTRAEAAAQVFLGVRLQCAKCHNHPFDRWTQDDYFGWSALFARVDYRLLDNRRTDNLDSHSFDGDQVVITKRSGELTDPRTKATAAPRLLDARVNLPNDADRLVALADWVADPANPYFARTQVNRVWYHLFGRGLVEPNDDFRATNPPTHPALLDELVREFRTGDYSLKQLVHLVMNSHTYQLSAGTADDAANWSHALVRPLAAEQLLDGLSRVLEVPVKFAGYPRGQPAGQIPGVLGLFGGKGLKAGKAERFLKTFGAPDRLLSCECERSQETTVVQSFQLLSGELLDDLLTRPSNRIGRLIEAKNTDTEIVRELYLAALTREPSAAELQELLARIPGRGRRVALEDVAWGLVNAKEFLLRR